MSVPRGPGPGPGPGPRDEELELEEDTEDPCCCLTAPRTLAVSGVLQNGALIIAHKVARREGWWPVLDSVSIGALWSPDLIFEEPPQAIGFFYAWDQDVVSGSQAVPSPPPPQFPDASLAYSQTFQPLGPFGGNLTAWRRFAVDIPARRDGGSDPCQLFAAMILTNPGAIISGNPVAVGSIRVAYRYRKTCGVAC